MTCEGGGWGAPVGGLQHHTEFRWRAQPERGEGSKAAAGQDTGPSFTDVHDIPSHLDICRAIETFRVAADIQPHDSTFIQLGKVWTGLRERKRHLRCEQEEVEHCSRSLPIEHLCPAPPPRLCSADLHTAGRLPGCHQRVHGRAAAQPREHRGAHDAGAALPQVGEGGGLYVGERRTYLTAYKHDAGAKWTPSILRHVSMQLRRWWESVCR